MHLFACCLQQQAPSCNFSEPILGRAGGPRRRQTVAFSCVSHTHSKLHPAIFLNLSWGVLVVQEEGRQLLFLVCHILTASFILQFF